MSLLAPERPEARRIDVLSKYAGSTVIAVGAHPDDLELGCGGTLARLSRAGARVVMVVVSIPSSLRSRRLEATRAAEILGCEVRFLTPNRCSRVEDLKTHQLVGMIDAQVKELEPAAMFTHCLANLHLDHKLAYEACMASQRLRYFDIFCYSPTSCHAVNIAFYPHAYIDISETIEEKMKAIRVHSSQFDSRGLNTERYREADSRMGQIIGADYAEGVEIVRMKVN
ncbi:MAG: PIG-L family deacetylase [Elusimicrobia bacterium]|nr:PIG-L family deacetylase [Elusimicrobiota bacterium]